MIKATNSITGKINIPQNLKGKTNASIIREYPELENIEITPTVEDQTYTPTKYGFEEVKVKGVQAYIDEDIKPEYIKDGVDILGVIGNVVELQGEEKTIIPSITQQIIVPSDGKNGMTRLTVEAVDSSIDENIKPENIKEGTNILGVDGQYRGIDTSDATAVAEDILEGKTAYVNGEKVEGTLTSLESEYNAQIDFEGRTTPNYLYQNITKIAPIDTSNLINFSNFFFGFARLKEVPFIDTSKGTGMNSMFYGCSSITTIPLIDTSNVTSMNNMFEGCRSLTTIPAINMSKVTNMNYMFSSCDALSNLPSLDTSKVVTMYNAFASCRALTKLPKLDISTVQDLRYAFYKCILLTKIELVNATKLKQISYAFAECWALINAPELDLSVVTEMNYTFQNCKALKTIPIYNWPLLKSLGYTFQNCTSLTEIPLLNTSNMTGLVRTFDGCSKLVTVPILDTSNLTSFVYTFSGCASLSDESLNNILAMCINAVKITNASYKTLKYIGLSSAQATRCQSLSNYDAFIAAGWKTGF